jgi:anti-sigma regulatory factor (Ser/Thr protein kinase)
MAEPGTVERTALNLILNAIEALEREGRLTVELSSLDGKVRLTVADDGRGMDEEALSRAFEPFYSTRPATDGVARATGLGLCVSRRLVERCGGTIDIESEPGRGTKVTVDLPAGPPGAEASLEWGAGGASGIAGEADAASRGTSRARGATPPSSAKGSPGMREPSVPVHDGAARAPVGGERDAAE